MQPRAPGPVMIALVLSLGLTTPACQTVRSGLVMLGSSSAGVTEEELRAELLAFANRFTVIVTAAADEIAEATADPQIRRRTLLWKLRMPPLVQQAVAAHDPREGYAEALTVAIAMRQYFTEGSGKDLFGGSQAVATAAAADVEGDAVRIGGSFLSEAQLDRLRAELEALARQHPIRGTFLRETFQAGLARVDPRAPFAAILDVPMAPFRAIAGVETGAEAIRDFNATAIQFAELVAELPERMRWQMELLSYDLHEQGGPLQVGLDAFESVARSADQLAGVAETLPEETRATVAALFDEIERSNATLGPLLADYRAAVADTNAVVMGVQPVVDSLERLAGELRSDGEPAGRPFDVLEYEQTAARIGETTQELRALVAELRGIEGTGVEALVDRITRNAIVVLAAGLALLLLYRFLAARVAGRRPGKT